MAIIPSQLAMQNILLSDIARYLHRNTWISVKPYKKGIQVFQGPMALNGDPLEIVLPTDEQAYDREIYIQSALDLLSALNEQTPENIAQEIRGYGRDVLHIRNPHHGPYGTIKLNLAALQIPSIKYLLAYTACAEDDNPRPNYPAISDRAATIVRNFEFAHTERRSFGFAIEAPVGDQQELTIFSDPELLNQPKSLNPELFDTQKYIIPPIERRVMERLIRGLTSLQQALLRHDYLHIVREYPSGLNANMCRAMLQMSDRHKVPLEYSIQWSPKIPPSSDVADFEPIIIDSDACLYLDAAREELKKFPSQEISIIGNVTGLISKDDPMGSIETPRLVMIKGLKRDSTSVNVAVMLSIEDYVLAHDAHINWRFIEISGELSRVGILGNYRNIMISIFYLINL